MTAFLAHAAVAALFGAAAVVVAATAIALADSRALLPEDPA